MNLPGRDMRLAGGLLCSAAEIDRDVWQEHVVKHPLGVNAIARSAGRDPWSFEGWDKLVPPVITEGERAELVKEIASLREGKLRCEVPEIRGKKSGSNVERLACRDCVVPIISRCEKLVAGGTSVGGRYAAVTEELLAAVEEPLGLLVPVASLHPALHRYWNTPDRLEGLVVLTIGLDARRSAEPIARLSRHDGVRAEFYLDVRTNMLSWRTTYRDFLMSRTGSQVISFLTALPRPYPRLGPVSEICVVPRRWWEAHVT